MSQLGPFDDDIPHRPVTEFIGPPTRPAQSLEPQQFLLSSYNWLEQERFLAHNLLFPC